MAASTRTYRLGPDAGQGVIKTTRAGRDARGGDYLSIDVTRGVAKATAPAETALAETGADETAADELSAATAQAELDLGSLVVREGAGGARPLSASDRRDIEST